MRRSTRQRILDGITFPLRAVTLFDEDRWGLSSLASERFDYVAAEVTGYCLDVGCGRYDRLVQQYLKGNGRGIDVYPYEGLTADQIVEDIRQFPFPDGTFDTVTFVANLNHVPRSKRDIELSEAYRCLKTHGKIVVTMGNPLAEILVHKVVYWYDKILGTRYDVDTQRGMHEEEEYYLTNTEIRQRLERAGFRDLAIKYFLTQWGLNHLFTAWKQ